MTQKDTINSLLKDMIEDNSIPNYLIGTIRQSLIMAYGVGYDMGRNFHRQRRMRIVSYDKKGNRIKPYGSVAEAARQLKCNRSTLYKAIKKRVFSHGFYWATEIIKYD